MSRNSDQQATQYMGYHQDRKMHIVKRNGLSYIYPLVKLLLPHICFHQGCYGSIISVLVGFWLNNAVSVFHGFGFFIQKMSIVLHITFVENDQTYYFVSNHTPDGQHCYVRL